MKTSYKTKTLSMISIATGLLLAPLAGCGGADSASGAEDEPVSSLRAALCTSAPSLEVSYDPNNSGIVVFTSPTATYGTAACPGRYVVQLDGTNTQMLDLFAEWGDALPTTQVECGWAYVSAEAYDPSGDTSGVTLRTAYGTWVSTGTGGYCNPPTLDLARLTPATSSSMRMEAYAGVLTYSPLLRRFLSTPAKVSVGYYDLNVPG